MPLTGKNSPVSWRCRLSCTRVTPACTQQPMSSALTCGTGCAHGIYQMNELASSDYSRDQSINDYSRDQSTNDYSRDQPQLKGRGRTHAALRAPASSTRSVLATRAGGAAGRRCGTSQQGGRRPAPPHLQHLVHAGHVYTMSGLTWSSVPVYKQLVKPCQRCNASPPALGSCGTCRGRRRRAAPPRGPPGWSQPRRG